MTRERGMFRVYRCPRCGHVDFDSIETEAEPSYCGVCHTMIVDGPGMIYTETIHDAKSNVQDLFLVSRLPSENQHYPVYRGFGVKKRVQQIILTLVDMNRGRPVLLSKVLQECVDAGIDSERALRFINLLEQEGHILNDNETIAVQEMS